MDMEELAGKLTSWIEDQAMGAQRRGVVLGLSGGLDSAVAAVLCKRAFPDNVLAVIMPCHSSETDIEHACAVASEFDIPAKTVALEEAADALLRALPDDSSDADTKKLAQANLKPRMRMLILYYLANRLGYLVVGTGNRSELAIGYFTKYGDGGVDILPLGNLVKRQVRELAAHLGIPQEIIDKPPSGGLWQGQTDEGEMGITYEQLDRYLTDGEAAPEIKAKIETLMAGCAHKKATPPIPPF